MTGNGDTDTRTAVRREEEGEGEKEGRFAGVAERKKEKTRAEQQERRYQLPWNDWPPGAQLEVGGAVEDWRMDRTGRAGGAPACNALFLLVHRLSLRQGSMPCLSG